MPRPTTHSPASRLVGAAAGIHPLRFTATACLVCQRSRVHSAERRENACAAGQCRLGASTVTTWASAMAFEIMAASASSARSRNAASFDARSPRIHCGTWRKMSVTISVRSAIWAIPRRCTPRVKVQGLPAPSAPTRTAQSRACRSKLSRVGSHAMSRRPPLCSL